ncbi:MAG: hypothetical protein CL583_08110 [Alteromonadaceae bacterium]|nr:hypothetical protein [Alteromonadaceae bacterium]|tara:strand:+ start:532 stop:1086 length:555 start_codon:yes stop_codon:yes gene_type:complete
MIKSLLQTRQVNADRISARALALLLCSFALLPGCVTVSDEQLSAASAADEEVRMTREQIITAGLAQGREQLRGPAPLRPFATVYSTVGGLRPVKFNAKDRQVSDSDSSLLLESIQALSKSNDLQAFAVYGVAEDTEGQRWFVVHFEERSGTAQLRQYPLPAPKDVTRWHPVTVEEVQSVVFTGR